MALELELLVRKVGRCVGGAQGRCAGGARKVRVKVRGRCAGGAAN